MITSRGNWSANHCNGTIVATFRYSLTPEHILLMNKLVKDIKFPNCILAVVLTEVFLSPFRKMLG
jgi:hypothetical protein